MSIYCNHVLIDIPPLDPVRFSKDNIFSKFVTRSSSISNQDINPVLVDFLASVGLYIPPNKRNLSFLSPPYYAESNIHIDSFELTHDRTALNFVYGGEDSTMNWYKPVDSNNKGTHFIGVGYRCIMFSEDEVALVHQVRVGFPSLINTGIPHNITIKESPRLCLSFNLFSKETDTYVTMEQAVAMLNQYC
jgi:hypothetical protein